MGNSRDAEPFTFRFGSRSTRREVPLETQERRFVKVETADGQRKTNRSAETEVQNLCQDLRPAQADQSFYREQPPKLRSEYAMDYVETVAVLAEAPKNRVFQDGA